MWSTIEYWLLCLEFKQLSTKNDFKQDYLFYSKMSEMRDKLKLIFSNQDNINIFEKYIEEIVPEEYIDQVIYEIGYMVNKDVKIVDVLNFLKNKKFGFNHSNFDTAKQKIKNIDMLTDDSFYCSDGVEKCSKCGSIKTITYSKQCRSADEGASVFIFCVSCKHRQVLNS